jgi:hypothetical protein
LSHAEIDHACRDAIKDAILHDQPVVSATALLKALQEKLGTHPR